MKKSGNEKTAAKDKLKLGAVDYYLTSSQLGAALTEGWLRENRDGTYKEYDYSGDLLSNHVIVKMPLFFECAICDKREQYSEEKGVLRAWDFGMDLNLVEADDDGGIRNTHVRCARKARQGRQDV
jgi:hypothetical protein